ncbi:MAG: Gfo/Idh/MocA family oxidoreductase [Dehalococcoidia bacterium]|nr:Gfo/Idh/MocA family oxidoreductase [Dehalococcoidia bacterium]
MGRKTTRRRFLETSAVIGAGYWVGGGLSPRPSRAANERIQFACVGVGGKGASDSQDAGRAGDVVAICDIDEKNLAAAAVRWPNAKQYFDFRKMFDEMGKNIDAFTVSTPDHCHAVVASMGMKLGKAAFVQKPLTHSVYEARYLGQLAAEKGVATQMGNQGTASNDLREAAAIIRSGALGTVKEVHVWTNRPIWDQGIDRPTDTPPVPPHVHWPEWIGPAEFRPYHPAYHPFKWRGWWAFGTGALGDMACHTLNMPFMALDLRDPVAVGHSSGATTLVVHAALFPGVLRALALVEPIIPQPEWRTPPPGEPARSALDMRELALRIVRDEAARIRGDVRIEDHLALGPEQRVRVA